MERHEFNYNCNHVKVTVPAKPKMDRVKFEAADFVSYSLGWTEDGDPTVDTRVDMEGWMIAPTRVKGNIGTLLAADYFSTVLDLGVHIVEGNAIEDLRLIDGSLIEVKCTAGDAHKWTFPLGSGKRSATNCIPVNGRWCKDYRGLYSRIVCVGIWPDGSSSIFDIPTSTEDVRLDVNTIDISRRWERTKFAKYHADGWTAWGGR